VRLVRIGSGLNGGTLIYLEDLGRAQSEAQRSSSPRWGGDREHRPRRRNPLSAINQAAQLLEEDGSVAPEGERLLMMIRTNAKRIDRIVGEVPQLNRRPAAAGDDRAQRLHAFAGRRNRPGRGISPGGVSIQARRSWCDLRSRAPEPIVWNLVERVAALPEKESSIRIVVRPGYMGDAVICELSDDGQGYLPSFGRRFSSVLYDAGRVAPASACISHESRRRQWRGARTAAEGSGRKLSNDAKSAADPAARK
jgi:two-component system sensor histidine kinase PilS (NtrC family)